MTTRTTTFTTIRTEGALLPADLLQRIREGANLDGLTPESYHRSGEKLNEAINRSWNTLQGVWANFRAAQERLPESDLGTSITRERWLLPLFRELDYGRLQTASAFEIGGKSYPISHVWERVPIHLVSYKVRLDERTKGVAGASAASPHSLLQVFLNRSDDHLWGFLSNGYRLRLLRDNASLTRQAYVEFDLEAMMNGEVYSDFVLLWLLCHQSRLEGERPADRWLERWTKVAQEQGTRALEQLRDGVEKAISALGAGFLEYPSNAELRDRLQDGSLKNEDYYRQLLRLVYRLLFLFVAEDRALDGRSVLLDPNAPQDACDRYMNYYSTQRLRRMAESFKGTRHPDLFEGLRLVMRLLSGESPHPKSFSQAEKDLQGTEHTYGAKHLRDIEPDRILLRRGTKDAALYEDIAATAMVQISRELRQRQTSAEEVMWEALRDRRLNNLKFRRQHPVANTQYAVDFLCYEAKLVVEADGGIHNLQKDADAKRQSDIEALGYRVIRFTNDEVHNDLQWVLATIAHAATPLSPFRRRAGDEGTPLALVPLGSFLFSDKAVADVIDCQISNRHLLDAIRALSQTYDQRAQVWRSVDYRNLGPEELGSVYESLLELHADISVPARAFALRTAGGNERKTTGSYYTPTSLINALLDSALDPVLDTVGTRHGVSAEEYLLSLKICDPACGSGHFLIAAAQRMAKRLAEIRTGEEEPPPAAVQQAKRDVIGRCIYGVDINPMAVELCKVNLWMEALEPGKPLSFLDSHIRVGNSLLGTTPALMAGGIPDNAFNPIAGDDKAEASRLKKINRGDRKARESGQRSLFEIIDPPADYAALTRAAAALNTMDDGTLADLRRKEAAFAALATDSEARKAQLLADAWCAAFVWEKSPHPKSFSQGAKDLNSPLHLGEGLGVRGNGFVPPLTDLTYRRLEDALRDDRPLSDELVAIVNEVGRLRQRYHFFHWHVTFPDVFLPSPDLSQGERDLPSPPGRRAGDEGVTGWHGGFSCVLGNPPWERIKIQEKEWFAQRAPEIAAAPNAAARKRMIDALLERDPYLLQAFRADQRQAEGESHYIRMSNRYPLTGRGDVNTYPLFAENSRAILDERGRLGMIVPSGIATDDTTKFFFQDLMQTRSLVSLYDFENREGIFPGVHRSYKFCLLTLRAAAPSGGGELKVSPHEGERFREGASGAQFVFFALNVGDLADPEKRFTLSAEDIRLLNPNTGTTATFRSRRDAEITKAIYRRVPVLIREEPLENLWEIQFWAMFHMSGDSALFRTHEQLEMQNSSFQNNRFVQGEKVYLPLYEAKLIHHFDHRWATYESSENVVDLNDSDKSNPSTHALPRYWIENAIVSERYSGKWDKGWIVPYRRITNTTNERTVIAAIAPLSAAADPAMVLLSNQNEASLITALITNLNSYALDFVARQKLGGTDLRNHFFQQFPIIPPHTYTPPLLDFVMPRVLELTYTAWDLQPFAQDVGYDGSPFIWDDERRFLMRCELDALYFHLYQISRDDVEYIMETFPIVRRKDEAKHGEYLTRRVILEMYDQMAALPTMPVPAPKQPSPPTPLPRGEGLTTYLVPDVSQWQTWLTPPPADERAAHTAEDQSRANKMRAASRSDWDNKPLPEQHATLKVERRFSEAEMEYIRRGRIPYEMENKWFMYCEDDTLYMHRSWTGICIYVAEFRKTGDDYEITRLLANRDPEQINPMDDAEYVSFFLETLDGFILRHVPK